MKVSYSWLKDYVDINIDPEKLADLLTMAGTNAASLENIDGGYVFDFEITANRSDCLSVIGLARETAALLGKRLKLPKELRNVHDRQRTKSSFNVELKAPDLCLRYTARIIKNVEVGPSREWLRERIIDAGLRPVNNVVDITNFVLLETGQPLHAFDLDRIKGGVIVRRSRDGEKIITIDNEPRICDSDTLVIADEDSPIAIAGVMGGLDTEVTDMTEDILLESAFFNPISIRRTSRALGISSESSYRFERRVDNGMVLAASNRASALIAELAGGEIDALIDVGNKSVYKKAVKLDLEKMNSLLNITLDGKKAAKILKNLGFRAESKKGAVKVTVPSFRNDVKTDVDLAEEIARVFGYDKIPLTVPRFVGNVAIKDTLRVFEERVKVRLARLGLNEIITYSLIRKDDAADLGVSEDELVIIKNPLSIDQEIMRPSLLPGMLGAISYNFNRKAKRLAFFELGKIYKDMGTFYSEEDVLSLGLAGIKREDWTGVREEFSFFDMKGVIERLLEGFGLAEGVLFRKGALPGFDESAASFIEYKGEIIGSLGRVQKTLAEKFDIEKEVFFGELHIKSLLKKSTLTKKYAPYTRYPSITRDISLVVDKAVSSGEITMVIEKIGETLVKGISLIGLYEGKQISEGKRGLLYRIEYRSDEKTLEDSEAERLHSEIKRALTEKLNVSFR